MRLNISKMIMAVGVYFLLAGVSVAAGGKVTYPDGRPVVGAKVHIDLDGVERFKANTDSSGRFMLPDDAFLNALVQIKAPDGKDFASTSLPIQLFASGEVAIILQPKREHTSGGNK